MNPTFLTLEQVLTIHAHQIASFGGLDGIRDAGILQSAVAAPQSAFGGKYLHVDLHAMAAAYVFHITRNHPFFDGNKRVGAAAGAIFLQLNGFEFVGDPDEYADVVLEVARGNLDKSGVAAYFRSASQPA